NGTVLRVDDHLSDSQPESAASRLGAAVLNPAIKPLENVRQMLAVNSDSLIFELYQDLPVPPAHLDGHSRRRWRVFDGVFEKDQKQILKKCFIPKVGNLLTQLPHDDNVLGLGRLFSHDTGVFQNFIEVEWLGFKSQLPRVGHG